METAQFLEKLRNREADAYSVLIETYSHLLWAVASQYISKSAGFALEDIEECVSDTFIEIWENPERYDASKGSLKSYLCAITKYKAINIFKKNAKAKVVYFEDSQHLEKLHNKYELNPTEDFNYTELYASLSALPEPAKEIMIRRYFYEQKPAQIAETMGLSKKEAENRLYRAKQTLQNTLTKPKEVQK